MLTQFFIQVSWDILLDIQMSLEGSSGHFPKAFVPWVPSVVSYKCPITWGVSGSRWDGRCLRMKTLVPVELRGECLPWHESASRSFSLFLGLPLGSVLSSSCFCSKANRKWGWWAGWKVEERISYQREIQSCTYSEQSTAAKFCLFFSSMRVWGTQSIF